MKIIINKKTKTAVLVTAILLFFILSAGWILLAVITVGDIASSDYNNYSRTVWVAPYEKGIADDRFLGVVVYVADGWEEKLTTAKEMGKTVFLFLSDNKESAVRESLLLLSKKNVVFCSQNRELLEKIYREEYVCCLWITDSRTETFLGTKMGYNCGLNVDKITAKEVERAHQNDHLIAATGVTNVAAAQCKEMQVDYAFVTDDFQ